MTRTIGVILIALGLIGLIWGGFSYTTRDKVADIGPIDITRDKKHSVPLPPVLGVVAFLGGVALLAAGKKAAG
jgi:hypothetical protein